jgi:dolichyl-phosphate mannosyltransferase polypeptide 3
MTRATRFLTLAVPSIIVYILALFQVLPVPFISEKAANEILPVVSGQGYRVPPRQSLTESFPGLCDVMPSYYNRRPTPPDHAPPPQLPFWLLVSFGSYSLSSLGLGLVRFNDCPDAYESLLKEISQAKDELRNQGVTVD